MARLNLEELKKVKSFLKKNEDYITGYTFRVDAEILQIHGANLKDKGGVYIHTNVGNERRDSSFDKYGDGIIYSTYYKVRKFIQVKNFYEEIHYQNLDDALDDMIGHVSVAYKRDLQLEKLLK